MKKRIMKIANLLLVPLVSLYLLGSVSTSYAQQIKWLRVTELQTPVNEIGAEYENEFTGIGNFFSWPAQYGIDQTTNRCRALWIGCRNFNDPVEGKVKSYKVIGVGTRNNSDRPNQIFEQEIKLIGKYYHPTVTVDDQPATDLDTYDILDEVDATLPCDRMVLVRFNTSIGVSVTKKVMVFASSEHGNYTINDYVFKNTGIYNRAGQVKEQTLNEVWFYFSPRYALAGVSVTGYNLGWGAWSSTWGNNLIVRSFGEDPNGSDYTDPLSPFYQLRGFYSWYGPSKDRAVSYDDDWGCPNEQEDGTLASAKYVGCATLHADKSSSDPADDLFQPRTTWYISPDIAIFQPNTSQYDEVFMADRYTAMSEGHPLADQQHYIMVDDNYPIDYADPRRQTGSGVEESQGFGPYTLESGDSIHIVFAEGVSGISWEKGREVGANWLQYYNGTGTPELVMPDGSTAPNHNEYKRAWVLTGADSILKTFRAAKLNYESGYSLPQPPPPPSQFVVQSGGDRIWLSWSDNATSHLNFDGYVIYRSRGGILNWQTVYKKIFECNGANAVHSFADTTAVQGFDYYYYIQSKDDGTQNDINPGKSLYSSLFWTITSIPANSQKPSGISMPGAVVNHFSLAQNYPNPFNPTTRIIYTLQITCRVRLSVHDPTGREVTVLVDGIRIAGQHEVAFSGTDLASGIYFYRLQTADQVITKKAILLK